MGKTQVASKEALSIQQELRRRGNGLELKFRKLKYNRIKIEDANRIQDLIYRFYELEPEYKSETVKIIAKKLETAIRIWNEMNTTRQDKFFDHMEDIWPLLKNF